MLQHILYTPASIYMHSTHLIHICCHISYAITHHHMYSLRSKRKSTYIKLSGGWMRWPIENQNLTTVPHFDHFILKMPISRTQMDTCFPSYHEVLMCCLHLVMLPLNIHQISAPQLTHIFIHYLDWSLLATQSIIHYIIS